MNYSRSLTWHIAPDWYHFLLLFSPPLLFFPQLDFLDVVTVVHETGNFMDIGRYVRPGALHFMIVLKAAVDDGGVRDVAVMGIELRKGGGKGSPAGITGTTR